MPCLLALGVEAKAEPVSFARNPVATKTTGGAKIEFAVSAPTDVAVFIEDSQGKIVRHLVAGVLGTNAPAPLKKGSLEQALAWDGLADYGRPAGAGPFRVRVALGLGAKFDKVVSSRPSVELGSNSRNPLVLGK